MEEQVEYFFDTYSIIELLKQNPNYQNYKFSEGVFTIFNLAELYYCVLRDYDEKKADEVYEQYKDFVVEIEDRVLKEAMKFRKEHKKKDFSYADSIGYVYAKMNNMKFLTGDKEFEGMSNVEFVK